MADSENNVQPQKPNSDGYCNNILKLKETNCGMWERSRWPTHPRIKKRKLVWWYIHGGGNVLSLSPSYKHILLLQEFVLFARPHAFGSQNKTVNNKKKKKTLTPKRASGQQIFAATLCCTPACGFGNKNWSTKNPKPKRGSVGAKFCSQLCYLLLHFSQRDKRRLQMMMRMIVPNWVIRVRLW
jgi:hypothetical protein